MSNLRKNIGYKTLLSISNYLLAFITFPYITRILGPNNFGMVSFAMNTVDYFLLFATMGIVNIGTREIAMNKRNETTLNQTFSNILGVNLICTAVVIILFLLSIFIVSRFEDIKIYLITGLTKIIFAAFAVEWFYTGTEKFKYISIRSLVINILYVCSVFIFIRKSSDTYLYFCLTILAVIINNVINFIYSFKFVRIIKRELFNLRYLKPNLKLGIYTLMTSMYVTFNVMYLGLTTNDLQVGYYSAGVKLYFVVVTLFASYTSVMMPRLASLLQNNNSVLYNHYLELSYRIVLSLAFPIIIVGIVFAPIIITLLSGSGYELSVVPMRIILPALIPVWMSMIIAFQGLIPMKRDTILVRASILGGVVAIIINSVIVPILGATGSAWTLLICEISVTIYYVYIVKTNNYFPLPKWKDIFKVILLSIPYCLIALFSIEFFDGVLSLAVAIIITIIYFIIINKTLIIRLIGK